MIIKPNVAYSYQKTPNLVKSFKKQSQAGLTIAMRSSTNYNRNVNSDFPVNFSTPNLGAGSPTLLATAYPNSVSAITYAGRQISGLGEVV